MPEAPPIFRPHERSRDTRPIERRLYSSRWQKARALFLAEHPLCEYCTLEGRATLATLIDHLYPHNGNATAFWNQEWWVASCTWCHNGMKQAAERKGRSALHALALGLGRRPMTG